jgi:hypothetical protein
MSQADPGDRPWTRERLRHECSTRGRSPVDFLFLPGPDREINPEGSVVIERRDGRVRVYVSERGLRDLVWFDDEPAAIEYAVRRYIWWEDHLDPGVAHTAE